MREDLQAVLTAAIEHLTNAAQDRRSAMHVPVVGTADGDLRMMVLRACAPDLAVLRFHTDARSRKVAAIIRQPQVSILAHDPEARVQLRLRGHARVELAGVTADAAWAEASAYARRCYLAQAAPGASLSGPASGLPAEVEGQVPSADQLLPARQNFAVMLVEPLSLDWLHLAHTGHHRAQFSRGAIGEAWRGEWVVP